MKKIFSMTVAREDDRSPTEAFREIGRTLSIEVTDEDGLDALTPFIQAGDYALLIWDWEQHMRGICKHGSEEDQKTTWDAVREKWFELKNSYGIRDVA